MNIKTLVSILISFILIFLIIGQVSAEYYYDSWWSEFYDQNDDYLNNYQSNQITVDFNTDGRFHITIYVPDNDIYLQNQIYDCILKQTDDPNANITTLKQEIKEICQDYGISNPDIRVTSSYGDDNFIYVVTGKGISMKPTITEGNLVALNKTHDFQVGDLVDAIYPSEHGGVIKRVADIKGNNVYLISDNVKGTFERNGESIEYEGLRTWVKMSDIQGVVIDIYDNHETIYV